MRGLLLGVLLCVAVAARAEALPGIVIVVIDGDTVLFRPDHYHPASRAFLKVRLAGIDAPERDQPHGAAATQALKAIALKQRATLDVVATDVYGRKVGVLVVGATAVNAELVRQGHAWASSRDSADALRVEQEAARQARRGLWSQAEPTPPWVWRRRAN